MNKKNLIIISIIILVVVAVGAFYSGMLYGKNQNATAARNSFAGFRNRTGGNEGSFTSGSIISKDATSITLQLPNNAGSKIIFYSGSTQIGKFTSGTADDLTTGANVSVTGTTNSDGTITAQNIQIRPAGQNNRPAQ